jgi:hypothetical protein
MAERSSSRGANFWFADRTNGRYAHNLVDPAVLRLR